MSFKLKNGQTVVEREKVEDIKNIVKISYKAEKTIDGESKLSRVIEGKNGKRVEIPINKDGSIKWFDDSQLIKKEYR